MQTTDFSQARLILGMRYRFEEMKRHNKVSWAALLVLFFFLTRHDNHHAWVIRVHCWMFYFLILWYILSFYLYNRVLCDLWDQQFNIFTDIGNGKRKIHFIRCCGSFIVTKLCFTLGIEIKIQIHPIDREILIGGNWIEKKQREKKETIGTTARVLWHHKQWQWRHNAWIDIENEQL